MSLQYSKLIVHIVIYCFFTIISILIILEVFLGDHLVIHSWRTRFSVGCAISVCLFYYYIYGLVSGVTKSFVYNI